LFFLWLHEVVDFIIEIFDVSRQLIKMQKELLLI